MADLVSITVNQNGSMPRLVVHRLLEVNPYHSWLKTLAIGSVFGVLGMMISGTWHCLLLSARLHPFLSQSKLRVWYPCFALSIAAMEWVGAWLLTTEEPTVDAPPQSVTSRSLRWIITVSFVLMSAYVLRLFEELPRNFVSDRLWPAMQFATMVTALLIFVQVRRLALRVDSPGLAWRASVALIGLVFANGLQLVPAIFPSLSHVSRQSAAWHFRNFQSAMIVLWSTIGGLVYIRLMVLTVGELWQDRRQRAGLEMARNTEVSTAACVRQARYRWLSFFTARQNGGNAPSGNAASGG